MGYELWMVNATFNHFQFCFIFGGTVESEEKKLTSDWQTNKQTNNMITIEQDKTVNKYTWFVFLFCF